LFSWVVAASILPMLFVPPHEELSDEEIDLANQIRGVLKPFGLLAGKGSGRPFIERVRALVAGGPLHCYRRGRPLTVRLAYSAGASSLSLARPRA
jgi:hypothetical protein